MSRAVCLIVLRTTDSNKYCDLNFFLKWYEYLTHAQTKSSNNWLKCVEPQIPTAESRGPERVVELSAARVIGRVHLQYFLNVSALLPFRLPTPNGDIHYFLKNIYGPFNKVDYMNIWSEVWRVRGYFCANLTVMLSDRRVFIMGFCNAFTVYSITIVSWLVLLHHLKQIPTML